MKKQLLFMFTALCSITAMAQVPTYAPANGLVAWYSFTGNANDGSGNSYNGTATGATLTTDRYGSANNAYYFNGSSRVDCPYDSLRKLIDYHRSFTVNLWFNRDASGNICLACPQERTLFAFDGANTSPYKRVYASMGQPNSASFGVNAGRYNAATMNNIGDVGTIGYADSALYVQPSTWYNFTYVYDGSQISLYINGQLMLMVPFTSNIPYFGSSMSGNDSYVQSFVIGAKNENNEIPFSGKLDDIGVWKRALTQCEINQLYTGSIINAPTASITPQGATTFCTGGFVNLNANTGTGYTYQWYNNNALIGGATNSTYSASQGGSYTVVVNNSGCTATSTALAVTVNTAPSGAVNVSGATTFCSGGSVTLTAQGTGTYLWSNNATGNSITVTQSGNYSVTVTANGCSATSGITAVTVNQTPIASITPVGSTTFCQGGFVTLNASGGGTYQWNTSATSASINANQSNTYSVIVTSNGCSATASQVVTVNPTPTVTLGSLGNLININAAPVMLSGSPSGGTYTGVGVSGSTFNPHTAGLGTHYIHYNYTTGAGCSGNATQSTIVYDTTGLVCTTYDTVLTSVTDTLIIHAVLTGVNPPNNTNTIKVYPNPASDHIYINNGNYASMTGYSCTITNALSQQVFYSLINQQQFYIDLSTWTGHGIYFLTIRNAANSVIEVKKIVIQ